MNLKKYIIFLFCCWSCTLSVASKIPIPVTDHNINKQNNSVEFDLTLPNNDVIRIDLSFNLLKASIPWGDGPWISSNNTTSTTTTTMRTTTMGTADHTSTNREFFSVEEAIEAFRQDLIKKEMDIAGIIESERPFYRHFKLVYDENSITIRCTYDSNYHERFLNISCFEYYEYQAERVLSNGDVEMVIMPDTSTRSDIEIINIADYKQTYKMNIT